MTDASAPRPKPRRARGLMDRRGPALALERELIANIAKVYEDWGFEPLETPAFEYAEALGKFLPDQDRPNEGVFAFEDDEEWVALRYDLTAPLARFVAENFDALPKPYRRWAAGPVWRNEKPGPGRYREFWQCDADTVGSASPAADAEMIAMASAALGAAIGDAGRPFLKVSDRRLLDGLLETLSFTEGRSPEQSRLIVLRAIDKLDRLGDDGVRDLLMAGRKDASGDFTPGAGLVLREAEDVIDFVRGTEVDSDDAVLNFLANKLAKSKRGTEGVEALGQLQQCAKALGLGPKDWRIDTSIVRGLEYYTGAVFEASIDDTSKYGSVGGGGRYDDLVARFRGEQVPATGFSIGVSRLATVLEARGSDAVEIGPVVVLVMDQARVADALAMADELRRAGVRAEAYLGAAGMKAQLKYADKRASPIAVIQGGDELAKGVVTLKDLKLGAKIASGLGEDREAYAKAREQVQVEVPRDQIVAAVQQMLAR